MSTHPKRQTSGAFVELMYEFAPRPTAYARRKMNGGRCTAHSWASASAPTMNAPEAAVLAAVHPPVSESALSSAGVRIFLGQARDLWCPKL